MLSESNVAEIFLDPAKRNDGMDTAAISRVDLKRANLIKELISTERHYLENLTVVRDIFIRPSSRESTGGCSNGKTGNNKSMTYKNKVVKMPDDDSNDNGNLSQAMLDQNEAEIIFINWEELLEYSNRLCKYVEVDNKYFCAALFFSKQMWIHMCGDYKNPLAGSILVFSKSPT